MAKVSPSPSVYFDYNKKKTQYENVYRTVVFDTQRFQFIQYVVIPYNYVSRSCRIAD